MTQHEKTLAEIDMGIRSLLEAIAADLHPEFGGGAASPCAYDTAWVAMVRDPLDPQKLAFPMSLTGLFDLQADDGSFGAPYPYTIVPTLAALLCLKKAPVQNAHTIAAAERALSYLERVLPEWDVATHESVAFEILVPQLLRNLETVGIDFAFRQKATLLAHYEKKMSLLAPERLYEKHSTLSHSLEAFGDRLDFQRLQVPQGPNGNYGGSPAATAAALIYGPWDVNAAKWLSYFCERGCYGQQGFVSTMFGMDVFEIGWTLHYLDIGGFVFREQSPAALVQKIAARLNSSIGSDGAGWSFALTFQDADDTALALAGIVLSGATPSLEPLLRYERADRFLCFDGERNPSTSTNAHVLYLLLLLPPTKQQQLQPRIDKVVQFLIGNRHPDGYWTDKWHASPHYATSCAVLALAESGHPTANEALENALRWTLDTQDTRQGGWGVLVGCTAEETAYALMTLFALQGRVPPSLASRLQSAIARGMTYLRRHAEPVAQRPSLWIAKQLYAPCRVVEAAILAMLRRGIDIPSVTIDIDPA